ncbi:MAG: hypothetical protein KBD21_00040 [Candidatus Pacebacteria bacterium]|nr:hypothetical protein [Candidatus Paceibacterota bacterium]
MDTVSPVQGARTENTPSAPQSFIPLGTPAGPDGWSWGAFMLGPFYLIAVRKYMYLWMYLLILVPVVNFFAWLGIMLFLGVKGRSLGYESATFTSQEQREGFFNAIEHAGKISFFIALAGIALWVIIMVLFVGSMTAMMR